MQAPGAMAGFAAHVLGIGALRLQAGMRRGAEVSRDRLVAGRALFGADELSAGNARRRHDRVRRFEVAAGKKDNR